MQMSQAYFQAAQVTSRFAPEQNDQNAVDDPSTQAQRHKPLSESSDAASSSAQSTTKTLSTQQVFAKYDLTDISPVDVDKMAAELRSSGFDDVGFILGLETRGENWRSHMQGALGDAGYEYAGGYDANAPADVIASTRTQLAMAHKYGEPTDFLTDQLAKMEEYHAQGHPQTAAASPSAQTAESLVLLQAQRIWIE